MLPSISGNEKKKISFAGDPAVIRRVDVLMEMIVSQAYKDEINGDLKYNEMAKVRLWNRLLFLMTDR